MHIHMYVCMYVYVYIYIYMYIHVCIHTHTHTHTHICVYMYIYIYICINHMDVWVAPVRGPLVISLHILVWPQVSKHCAKWLAAHAAARWQAHGRLCTEQ